MGTPGILLYYHPHSFYCQKVVMALHEKKIPFETRFVNICVGKQFSADFLTLNPRGEVPVLLDDNIRRIPDSTQIIDYLEDNFSNGHPRLRPEEPDLKQRCDQLTHQINALKVEALSYGTAVHGSKDLNIHPKPPYSYESQRVKMRDVVEHRLRILRTEAKKFPQHAEALNQKYRDVEHEMPLINNREQYEGLILQFERIMDECEAELASHEDANWWLVSPRLSIADVSLGILLFRLWQLGFERRMWQYSRPNLDRYFKRIKQLDSFKKATSMNLGLSNLFDFFSNPYAIGVIGAAAAFAGGYFLWNKAKMPSIRSGFIETMGSAPETPVAAHIQGQTCPLNQPPTY